MNGNSRKKKNNGVGASPPLPSSLVMQDEKYSISVRMHKASVEDGLTRGYLIGKAFEEADSISRAAVALHTNCTCCSEGQVTNLKNAVIWDVANFPVSEFRKMEEEMVEQWLEIAFKLNPRWVPDFTFAVDQKKT